MTNSIRENEHDLSDVNDIFDNKDSFSEESVAFDDDVKENESDPPFDSVTSSQILYNDTQQEEELKPALNSKFYAIRITGGQEQVVANILQNKINTKKINILSILVLENFKGYIIVEAPDSNVAFEALHGVRHVRGQIRGELPFKAMKAKITRVDYEKQEATVVLLDSPYQIPVTVDANYLKKLMQ